MTWQRNQKHVKIYKHISYVYNAIIFVYILMFSNLGGIWTTIIMKMLQHMNLKCNNKWSTVCA